MRDIFARYATNVIASVAFGLEIDCIKNPDCDFHKYSKRIFEPALRNIMRIYGVIMMPKLSKLLGTRFVDKDIGDFMIDVVRQNAEYREKNDVIRKDFFQLLMQLRNTGKVNDDDDWSAKANSDEKSITLEEISEHAFAFFIGGFESSSSTMSFCLYELATHPGIQQKVYEEITDVLRRHNGKLTYDSVTDMKYMDCCLHGKNFYLDSFPILGRSSIQDTLISLIFTESLRMHPPFPIVTRKCSKNYQIPGSNVIIEKRTPVYFSTIGLQCDAKYYDDPKQYKPERYSDTQTTKNEMPNFIFGEGKFEFYYKIFLF